MDNIEQNFLKVDSWNKDNGFKMSGYFIWCSSVVYSEEDNLYHMFASRWPTSIPFHPGWLIKSEIVRATSKNLLGPYEFQEVVFEERGSQYWDGKSTHNPRVVKHNNEYVMFYIGMTYPYNLVGDALNIQSETNEVRVARASKRIGIATSKSPKGPWIRRDRPILETKPNSFYSLLTSNPSPIIHEDGSVYLMFKGRYYLEDETPSPMQIGVAKANSINDEFEVVTSNSCLDDLEDPYVWYDSQKGVYSMIAKDMSGKYTILADGIYAESADGINWTPKQVAYKRELIDNKGELHKFDLLERPFLYFEDEKIAAFFMAISINDPYSESKNSETWACAVNVL